MIGNTSMDPREFENKIRGLERDQINMVSDEKKLLEEQRRVEAKERANRKEKDKVRLKEQEIIQEKESLEKKLYALQGDLTRTKKLLGEMRAEKNRMRRQR